MFLKLRLIFYSLIFFLGLEIIAYRHGFALFVMIFLFFFSVYQGARVGRNWIFSILPVFFTLSSAALLYLVTISSEKQVFIFLASGLYYLSLLGSYRLQKYAGDLTAKSMNMAATSAALFFTFSSAYGFYLNFLVPIYYLMLIYSITSFLVSYQYFFLIKKENNKEAILYSSLLALLMAEIVWMLNYWPFGYLTTGVIALILYYILWELSRSHILNQLSRKRVVFNMIFLSLMVCIVLLTSKWIPAF
jgi:hypothetical protein